MVRFTLAVTLALSYTAYPASLPAAEATAGIYNLTWDSPSEDSNGTMPLGNGEVALNAWVEPSGDLRFYIARTDTWGDNARLLKVGSLRIRVGDSSAQRTQKFQQVLSLKNGAMTVQYGEGDQQVSMRLWVDAHRPVICVEVQTPKPTRAAALVELWRTAQETLATTECSDIYGRRPEKTVVEPDTVLTGLSGRVGWYHRNIKSVGPALCAKIQGVADFPRPDPLLHRTFGALVATDRAQRTNDLTLVSAAGTSHVFEIYVHTKHPASAAEWLTETQRGLDETRRIPLAERRAAHQQWWAGFWNRSWIHVTPNGLAAKGVQHEEFLPANKYPLRIGMSQSGGERFVGELGRVGIYQAALDDAQIQRLAATGHDQKAGAIDGCAYSDVPAGPMILAKLADCKFANGFTVEAWIKPDAASAKHGMRIVDKIKPGGADGFLFDTHPGTSLRLIVGRQSVSRANVLRPGQWQHVAASVSPKGWLRIYHNGKLVSSPSETATGVITEGDDASIVSRAYALQRYVAACAGRGRYPIKFNGSLFTVPAKGQPGDADYRRWGPGYWWQNTRLPYYSMCASGDFEMMEPLFRMYARDLMPLQVYRTRRYLGHDGAYIPECIYFWGDMFTETYGWQPFEERTDKLQASGWHKWEWVSGLELVGLMLDYCEHTGDTKFLAETALPAAHEILTFFDQHYKTGPDGKLYMHPSQALETWWDCVNPMPEVAGLHATVARLLALPEAQTTAAQRAFWRQLQAKLPDVPTLTEDGKTMLAPAKMFKIKHNIENPELYAVFPFRLVALEKPHLDWGLEALARRKDKGAMGWRQDDVFMAYLGQADQAREYLVRRARSKHAASRFPVFWGPNYDWVPDQDHGSILLKTLQALLLQTDGRQIYLLPAWPKDWDAEFKLRAPYSTTVCGKVEKGRLVRLHVEPKERAQDVKTQGSF